MIRGILIRLALVLAALAALPAAASAHAMLRTTDPMDGATLGRAPASVSIRFSEPVLPVSVRLIGAAGDVADPLQAAAAGDTVTLPVPPGLADGRYLLSWRVTSIDGHPVVGSIGFTIGNAGAAAAPVAAAADDPWPLMAGRFLQYAALLAALGGAMFIVLRISSPAAGDRLEGLVRLGAGIASVATVVTVGLEGVALLGTPIGTLLLARPWVTGAATSAGTAGFVTLGGLVLLQLALGRRRHALGRAAVLLGAIVAAAGLALTGHAGTAGPRWLAAPALSLHVVAAAFWVGSFLPLLLVLRHDAAGEGATTLMRFSLLATAAVAGLVVCGVVLALIQVPGAVGLIDTDYGIRLLAKLALVLAMLGLAAFNRWRLTPRLAGGDASARRVLGRSIGAEMVLALAVVALTASLGSVPPPRAIEGTPEVVPCAADAGTRLALSGAGIGGGLTVLPACTGTNQFYLTLQDTGGQPLATGHAELRLERPAGGDPVAVALDPTGAGRFRGVSDALTLPGAWKAEVVVQLDGTTRVTLLADLPIGQK